MSSLPQSDKGDVIPISGTPYFLSPLQRSDLEALVRVCNDPDVFKFTLSVPKPYSLADGEYFLNHITKLPDHCVYAIRDPKGKYIGTIGLSVITPDKCQKREVPEGSWEVGYYLAKEWRRKGVMSSAVQTIVEEVAFKRLGLKEIVGFPFTENWASRRTLEKAGFVFLGEVKEPIDKLNEPGTKKRFWKLIKQRSRLN
ncbi:uncharacterized protein VTP21DRAFT_660 [Calcarisporiella thermophila]|uniref:uncharacterized protein n=1 Tax=Calcarisporiella thermophila TaxID=911321 RepID=UPI003742C1AD